MLTQITNGVILTPNGWLKGGSLILRDSKIYTQTNIIYRYFYYCNSCTCFGNIFLFLMKKQKVLNIRKLFKNDLFT